MNPFTAALHYYRAKSAWLGDGGVPVPQLVANARASICKTCLMNQSHPIYENLAVQVANQLRRQIELKANMKLAVAGEDGLHICEVCWCVLSLLVWVDEKVIAKRMEAENARAVYPPHCWKLACRQ